MNKKKSSKEIEMVKKKNPPLRGSRLAKDYYQNFSQNLILVLYRMFKKIANK